MNSNFKLKDIKKDRLIIFDLDDTLIKTDAKVKILNHRTKKIICELTSKEFNEFKKEKYHVLNFDDFECPEILKEGVFIKEEFQFL